MERLGVAKTARRRVSGAKRDPQGVPTVTTFWLAGTLKPASAWRLVTLLKSAGPEYAPASFRTDGAAGTRVLGRRAEAVVVERLSMGEDIELLRRAGRLPRRLLRAGGAGGRHAITMYGPALASLPDVMAFVEFVKQLYDVLRPTAGVVNGGRAEGVFPGWLTVFGPEKVEEIGAAKLLMAPAFLIETLPDGGLLVVATPLPGDGRGADRRSSALADHILAEVVWPEAPLSSGGTVEIATGIREADKSHGR